VGKQPQALCAALKGQNHGAWPFSFVRQAVAALRVFFFRVSSAFTSFFSWPKFSVLPTKKVASVKQQQQ
jgi:hypothetical protein